MPDVVNTVGPVALDKIVVVASVLMSAWMPLVAVRVNPACVQPAGPTDQVNTNQSSVPPG